MTTITETRKFQAEVAQLEVHFDWEGKDQLQDPGKRLREVASEAKSAPMLDKARIRKLIDLLRDRMNDYA